MARRRRIRYIGADTIWCADHNWQPDTVITISGPDLIQALLDHPDFQLASQHPRIEST